MKYRPSKIPTRKSIPKQMRIILNSGETAFFGGDDEFELTSSSFVVSSVELAKGRLGEAVEFHPFVESAKRKTWLSVGAILMVVVKRVIGVW